MITKPWFTLVIAAAAFLGWLLGMLWPDHEQLAALMSLCKTAFLAALKLIIAPLILFSLVSGILRLAGTRDMRRIGATTMLYYLSTTGIAIVIGLLVVTFWHPWTADPPLVEIRDFASGPHVALDVADTTWLAVLTGLLQQMLVNPFTALAELNILGIVGNGLLFGLAALVVLPRDSQVINVIHDLTQVAYRVAAWLVAFAPIGILGIVFHLAADIDADFMLQLLSFCAVVFAATAFHGLIVLPLIAGRFGNVGYVALARAVTRPMLVALTTSSSAATLPVSLEAAKRRLGVSNGVASFVLPLGATINMDGTALFEGIAAVFLAYLFGVELGTAGIVTVFLVAMISSIGAPGIPSGSMAGMQMVLLAVGIPLEAIGILLLIERPLDTFRTAVNVEGDLIACAVTQRFAPPEDALEHG